MMNFMGHFEQYLEIGPRPLHQIDRKADKEITEWVRRVMGWRKKALRSRVDSEVKGLLRKAESAGAEDYLKRISQFLDAASLEDAQELVQESKKFERIKSEAERLFDQDKYIQPVQGLIKENYYPAERYLTSLSYVGGYLIRKHALPALQ